MWTNQEDEIVKKAVMKYGTNQWDRVASLLSRHNAASCRQRWFDVLDPRLQSGSWSAGDDLHLLELARTMPNMWRSIGLELNRSGDECHARFLTLSNATPLPPPEHDTAESNPNELAAANARLSSSMGRKAQRKQRERKEKEEKFAEAVINHRKTGEKLVEYKFSRPTIDAPHQSTVSPVKSQNLPKVHRKKELQPTKPRLVLSPPVEIDLVGQMPKPHPETIQQILDELPPPQNRKSIRDIKKEPILIIE